MKTSKSEYLKAKKAIREAEKIIQSWHRQEYGMNHEPVKVKLSDHGRYMQKAHNKTGFISDRTKGTFKNDYSVEITWSDGKSEWMHVDHIKYSCE